MNEINLQLNHLLSLTEIEDDESVDVSALKIKVLKDFDKSLKGFIQANYNDIGTLRLSQEFAFLKRLPGIVFNAFMNAFFEFLHIIDVALDVIDEIPDHLHNWAHGIPSPTKCKCI